MEHEIERLIRLLPALNPVSEEYERGVQILKDLIYISKEIECPNEQAPATDNYIEEIQVKEEEKEQPVSVSMSYTKEEVRALLSSASKSGVQIQPIIAKFVPEGKPIKFSEIPASSYQDLVREVNNAG